MLLVAYILRVYVLNGWFIVTYGLGIYLLNLFIGFISPVVRKRGARAAEGFDSGRATRHRCITFLFLSDGPRDGGTPTPDECGLCRVSPFFAKAARV